MYSNPPRLKSRVTRRFAIDCQPRRLRFKSSTKSKFSFWRVYGRPLFAWNHRWAMARGLESLQLELLRRRGVPVGPPPSRVSALRSGSIVLAGVVVVSLLTLLALTLLAR